MDNVERVKKGSWNQFLLLNVMANWIFQGMMIFEAGKLIGSLMNFWMEKEKKHKS